MITPYSISPATTGGRSRRRVSVAGHGFLLTVVLLAGTQLGLAGQAPFNDAFAARITLSGSTNTASGNNISATAEPGEPAHAGQAATRSMWWTWTAPDDGAVTLDTVGSSFDTVLAVYTGDAVTGLSLVAANDDAPGLPTSALSLTAVRGVTYQIAVDGFAGAGGDVTLHVRLPVPPRPPFIHVGPLSRTLPDAAGSNAIFSVSATGSFPLFFEWQRNGIRLPGGDRSVFNLENVTSADAGDYRVVITNAHGSVTSAVAVLTVLAPPANDAFADRSPLTARTNMVAAHNVAATREPGEPVHGDVPSGGSIWWTWTAPANGLVLIDTAGSTNDAGLALDTVLAVYTGNALDNLIPIVANDDALPGATRTSQTEFRATAGAAYHVAVSSRGESGGIALRLAQAPDNDFFANALEFPPDVTRVRDDNAGATKEPGEPNHGVNPGGRSVWWTWLAPSNGFYTLDTLGSEIDTVLAVYTGTAVGSLALVAEDNNRSEGGASLVKFAAVGGVRYQFTVDGYTDATGTAVGPITLNLTAATASNDDFGHRITLSGRTNVVNASNIGASHEPGEPAHGGNPGGRSLWWTWKAPITGPATVTTSGSGLDTTLGVYLGSTVEALFLVADNDDADPADPSGGSTVTFDAVAGVAYQIAVDGYRAPNGTVATGPIVLMVTQIPALGPGSNDHFADRRPLTGSSSHVTGNNSAASKEAGEPDHAGNAGGRSLWWSWVAPASTPVSVHTVGSGIDTVLAVYTGDRMDSLALVAADRRSAGEGRSIATFEAIAGAEYQIAIDGFNNGDSAAAGLVSLTLRQFPVGPQHANDDFAHATPLTPPFLSSIGSNIGASREVGEPAHAGAETGRSVWWTWTATVTGPVTISTEESQFDTVLGIYTGVAPEALTFVADNDDISPGELQSRVTFQAEAGTVYRIAVDGYAGEFGVIRLTVSPSDSPATAPQIHHQPADQTRFRGGAGGGTNATFRVLASGAPPLFYQWTRDSNPVLGANGPSLTLTNVSIADAGTYRVTVSNALGVVTSAGAELTWIDADFNDDFEMRLPIAGASHALRGSLIGAGKQAGESHHGGASGGRSVWWSWTAPADGLVEMHTFGSAPDTLLAVYTGNALGSLSLVQQNDDLLPDREYASRVVFQANAGTEYQIAIDAVKTNGTDGNVRLSIRQPPAPPEIPVQPMAEIAVPVAAPNFSVSVAETGLIPLFQYQWRFNEIAIPDGTNRSLALGALDRSKSGAYSVAITNEFGSVTSSNVLVHVLVPQEILPVEIQPNGAVHLSFSDPDGALSPAPDRFEVHHTFNPSGPTTVWITNSGSVTTNNGRLFFIDPTADAATRRFYRVIEK